MEKLPLTTSLQEVETEPNLLVALQVYSAISCRVAL